jgi:hypothetical protein
MEKAKAKKPKGERKIEKELLLILGFMVFLVILFLFASSVFKSLNKVEYEGLVFTKESFGEIPVFHNYYYFRSPTGNLVRYNLFVRNDPTENDVPIEGGKIRFVGGEVYFTLDTTYLNECSQTILAVSGLTKFLSDNQLNVLSGNMDFAEAAVNNQNHITCETNPNDEVIQLRRGDETKITVTGPGSRCKDITIGPDCKVLEAIEKFEIHSFLDAQR